MFWKIVMIGALIGVHHSGAMSSSAPKNLFDSEDYVLELPEGWKAEEFGPMYDAAIITYMPKQPLEIGVGVGARIEFKSIQEWFRIEKIQRPRSGMLIEKEIKIDGKNALLYQRVVSEDDSMGLAASRWNSHWSAAVICRKKVYTIGASAALNKIQREEARKETKPPKELQQLIDGFKCKPEEAIKK